MSTCAYPNYVGQTGSGARPRSPAINTLPLELLGRIFSGVPFSERACLGLVCTRWRATLKSSNALFSVRIDAADMPLLNPTQFQSLVNWLSQHRHCIKQLDCDRVLCGHFDEFWVPALQILTGLESLSFGAKPYRLLSHRVVDLVSAVSGLQKVCLFVEGTDDVLSTAFDSLRVLTGLHTLTLGCLSDVWPHRAFFPCRFPRLASVTSLSCLARCSDLPEITCAFPNLQQLHIQGSYQSDMAIQWSSLSSLTSLSHFHAHNCCPGRDIVLRDRDASQLSHLKSLCLTAARQSYHGMEIQSNFFQPLAQLTSLVLAGLGLTFLPKSITELSVLQQLDISDNNIYDWDFVGKLSCLEQLDVSFNTHFSLQDSPSSFTALPFTTLRVIGWGNRDVHVAGIELDEREIYFPISLLLDSASSSLLPCKVSMALNGMLSYSHIGHALQLSDVLRPVLLFLERQLQSRMSITSEYSVGEQDFSHRVTNVIRDIYLL